MKTATKVLCDRLLGVPVARMLNVAARVVGEILRRDHTISPYNVRSIVFAKYVGMGSIVQATAMIRSVKARFPDAKILFLTNRTSARLVERLDHVDAVITVDDRNVFRLGVSSLAALYKLIGHRIDLFFDLEVYSAYASVMALLSCARNRLGFYRKSAEHKLGNYTHLLFFNAQCQIRYIYLQLARIAGVEPVGPDHLGPIHIRTEDMEELEGRLRAADIPQGGYLVVTPNADLMSERRLWPGDRFSALAADIVARTGLHVVFTGVGKERPYVEGIVRAVGPEAAHKVHNFAGEVSLGGLLALLKKAACLVTIDTGPMHMAWALGTPSVCLFGPGDPGHYAWEGPGVEILYHRVYCSPCLYETDEAPCRGNNTCMKEITTEAVMAALQRVLSNPPPSRFGDSDARIYMDQSHRPLGRIIRGAHDEVRP